MGLGEWIKQQGRALGFTRVGIAPATDLPELARLPEWQERGYAGQLDYMHNPRRRDVRAVLPAARSVICCALAYDTPHPRSTEVPQDADRGWISRYAWGEDYHNVVGEKLAALRAAIAARLGAGFQSKLYVDTGPVLERVYGKHAGLGWQAKNTCLLDTELGSFFFVGVLVTNLELTPDTPLPDGCGSCTLCLEACPTGALVEPYVLDARRCISYLTIELRGAIPEEFRQPLGQHVFGCDICQDVCPYNQRAWVTDLAAFQPRPGGTRAPEAHPPGAEKSKTENRRESSSTPADSTAPSQPGRKNDSEPRGSRLAVASGDEASAFLAGSSAHPTTGHGPRVTGRKPAPSEVEGSLFHPRLDWLAGLGEEEFRQVFRGSALKRAKWQGLLRNVLVAMGNSGNPKFRAILERFAAAEDDSLLAEHARWALARLSPERERKP